MFLFHRHDILVLPRIPRDRPQLQELLNSSRRQRRRSRLTRWAALNCVCWALFILIVWMPMQHPAAPASGAPARTPAAPLQHRGPS